MAFSFPSTFLSGGIDATNILTSFRKNSVVAVSYYDGGIDNQGHESELSEPVEILINTKLIKVSIAANTEGYLRRYGTQRVYCKLPSGPTSFSAANPDHWAYLGDIPNEPGASREFSLSQTAQNFFIAQANLLTNYNYENEVFPKLPKNAPVPCTMFEMVNEKIFCSGNLNYPSRIWYSSPQTKAEIIPESFNTDNYIELSSRKEEGMKITITSLKSNEAKLIVHSARGITYINPITFARQYSRSDFGALNPSCDSRWNNAAAPYFGSDGVLYELQNMVAFRSELANKTAWQLMREFVDLSEIQATPWRANMEADPTNQLVVLWVPCRLDSNAASRLAGFIFDSSTKTLVGPLTGSGIISSCKASSISPQVVGMTEDGNIVVIDLSNINRDGFNLVANPFNDPNIGRNMIISTQLIDLGTPYEKKAFLELQFTTVEGSFSKNLIIEIENDEGHKKILNYGKVNKTRNKCVFIAQGCAIRITMKFECDITDYLSIRDITLAYDTLKLR